MIRLFVKNVLHARINQFLFIQCCHNEEKKHILNIVNGDCVSSLRYKLSLFIKTLGTKHSKYVDILGYRRSTDAAYAESVIDCCY